MEKFHKGLKRKHKVKLMTMIGDGLEAQEAPILGFDGSPSMEIKDGASKGAPSPKVKRNEKQVFEARSSL
eukprot:5328617-Amphidinium_carterae.1